MLVQALRGWPEDGGALSQRPQSFPQPDHHCRIGGAAMVLGHLTIADGVTISPGSMITRSITRAGTYTALMPFQTHEEWLRTAANVRHLDRMAERLKALEKEIAAIKAHGNER